MKTLGTCFAVTCVVVLLIGCAARECIDKEPVPPAGTQRDLSELLVGHTTYERVRHGGRTLIRVSHQIGSAGTLDGLDSADDTSTSVMLAGRRIDQEAIDTLATLTNLRALHINHCVFEKGLNYAPLRSLEQLVTVIVETVKGKGISADEVIPGLVALLWVVPSVVNVDLEMYFCISLRDEDVIALCRVPHVEYMPISWWALLGGVNLDNVCDEFGGTMPRQLFVVK
jgi:hypothetical protein